MDAKAKGGTNLLSDTLHAPVKQKSITSQMLPFPQGWLSLLSIPRNRLPLSPFPCHQEAQILSLLARTWCSPTHTHSDLGRAEGGKGHSWAGHPAPGLHQTLGYNPSTAWSLPRSENHKRFSLGLQGRDGRPCALLSCYKAQIYIKWFVSVFLLTFGFSLGFASRSVNCPDKWKSFWNYVAL